MEPAFRAHGGATRARFSHALVWHSTRSTQKLHALPDLRDARSIFVPLLANLVCLAVLLPGIGSECSRIPAAVRSDSRRRGFDMASKMSSVFVLNLTDGRRRALWPRDFGLREKFDPRITIEIHKNKWKINTIFSDKTHSNSLLQ